MWKPRSNSQALNLKLKIKAQNGNQIIAKLLTFKMLKSMRNHHGNLKFSTTKSLHY